MKKLFAFLIVGMSGVQEAQAQFNALQSQYMLNPVVINPAYAGVPGCLSTSLSYRRQWMGFEGAPETYAFTAHLPLRNRHFNTGLIVSQDNLAVLHQTHAELLYTYRVFGNKFSLAAGFSPGVSFIRNSWNAIETIAGNDDAFAMTETSMAYSSGYGIYFNTKRFFLGLSGRVVLAQHSQISMTEQPLMAHTGVMFGNPEDFTVTVSVLGRYMLNSYYQADINLLTGIRDRLFIGASYRPDDAVVGILQCKLNDQFRLGYSYDFVLSRLRTFTTGTHEIALRYDFGYRVKAKSPRTL